MYLQSEKKPGDVWNMCTGTRVPRYPNCARNSLPRAVIFATCSGICRGLGPTFHHVWPWPDLSPTLCSSHCRRGSLNCCVLYLRPCSCWSKCSLLGPKLSTALLTL